ncbi:MAG: hypothetical protein R3C44_14355 [Chloroflexota bacterium]
MDAGPGSATVRLPEPICFGILFGTGDGISPWTANFVVAGNQFYFPAISYSFPDNNNRVSSLWRSDGTSAGTVEVPLNLPTDGDPSPDLRIDFKGELFFLSSDDEHGKEPWITKNGGASASFIKDINPVDTLSSLPNILNYVNGYLFFRAKDSLWQSDGSEQGTKIVVPYEDGVQEATWDKDEYGIVGDWLYFLIINSMDNQNELWRTNGTSGSMKHIYSWEGTSFYLPAGRMTGVGDLLYFAHADYGEQLWRSDGTSTGTFPVFHPEQTYHQDPTIGEIAGAGDQAFFVADTWETGAEVYVSDGTEKGTHLVKDIVPGEGADSDPQELIGMGDVLFFTVDDDIHGRELWRSDGTSAGTHIVKDIHQGGNGSDPAELSVFKNILYFSADDGEHGRELWRSDGTTSGTYMVKDALVEGGGIPIQLTPAQDWLYYMAWDDTNGYQPWKTDGTLSGTRMIIALEYAMWGWASDLTAVDNTLYFNLQTDHGTLAYQSDGTAEGTFAHADAFPGFGGYEYKEMTPAPGRLFFVPPYSYAGEEPAPRKCFALPCLIPPDLFAGGYLQTL